MKTTVICVLSLIVIGFVFLTPYLFHATSSFEYVARSSYFGRKSETQEELKEALDNDGIEERFNAEWWKKMAGAQYERKTRLKKVCQELYGKTPKSSKQLASEKQILRSLLVSHEHKFIYSVVHKVSSSSWMRAYVEDFEGCEMKPTDKLYNHRCLRWIKDISDEENMTACIDSYPKFLFVRNPLARLVSAFKDKFIQHFNWYYGGIIAKKIIQKHRETNSTNNSTRPTFNEFITYVLHSPKNRLDWHWKSIYNQSQPCEIDYDIIGKLEDAYDDIPYVLMKLGIWNITQLGRGPRVEINSKKDIQVYFSKVPLDMLHKIYEIYEKDFTLFGYDMPTLFSLE